MLATALTRYARILWVDPPVSPVTRSSSRHGGSRLPLPRVRHLAPGVVGFTPSVLPLHSRPGIRHTTPWLVRAQIRWALRRLGARPYAVIDCRLGQMLGGWGDRVRNVLYGTDDYVAGAALMGVRLEQVQAMERRSLEAADLVLAVSPPLVDRWRSMGADVLLLPNGVQTESYAGIDDAEPAADVDLPAPVAGVVGHLSARIDIAMLEAVVAEECSLLLVGPVDPRWEPERFARLCRHPRVAWLGFRPYESLLGYLRHVDVGLTPYVESDFNRASFPLKTLEYLAAGRPAVSTDLPATRWLATDLIRIASDASEFAKAARESGTRPQPELAAARRAFAERHSWRARAAEVAEALGLAAGER
jgi:teichuronic acid biosynthesis glycosyltransferase TuaH